MGKIFILFIVGVLPSLVEAITFSGSINSSSVVVTGDIITISSMTVDRLKVTNVLDVSTIVPTTFNRIIQTKSTSAIMGANTGSSTWSIVSTFSESMALSNPSNFIQVSLTGAMMCTADLGQPCYVTIFRDATNIGNMSTGVAVSNGPGHTTKSVAVNLVDRPGDTSQHVYQTYILTKGGLGSTVYFPWHSTAYLLLEEIGP